MNEIHTATHPARLERREEAERIEQARPNQLLKRVYGQKEVRALRAGDAGLVHWVVFKIQCVL